MIPLTNEERKLHREQKVGYTCKKEFSVNDKECHKVRDRNYTGKYKGAAI